MPGLYLVKVAKKDKKEKEERTVLRYAGKGAKKGALVGGGLGTAVGGGLGALAGAATAEGRRQMVSRAIKGGLSLGALGGTAGAVEGATAGGVIGGIYGAGRKGAQRAAKKQMTKKGSAGLYLRRRIVSDDEAVVDAFLSELEGMEKEAVVKHVKAFFEQRAKKKAQQLAQEEAQQAARSEFLKKRIGAHVKPSEVSEAAAQPVRKKVRSVTIVPPAPSKARGMEHFEPGKSSFKGRVTWSTPLKSGG
jgi:hypothetical protein